MRVVVGRVGRPHGIRGEVVIGLRTDEPDLRFAVGATVDARSTPDDAGPDDDTGGERLTVASALEFPDPGSGISIRSWPSMTRRASGRARRRKIGDAAAFRRRVPFQAAMNGLSPAARA